MISFVTVKFWIYAITAISGLVTLMISIISVLRSLSRTSGRSLGATSLLRRSTLIVATILFFLVGLALWKPLPFDVPQRVTALIDLLGILLFFPGLFLYLWGLTTLGEMFGPSSGFGVRLYEDHTLIKHGPYAVVRHPMYVAVILSGIGGTLIFRTWSLAIFTLLMFGLLFRGKREEEILADAFGEEWLAYKAAVPGWLPRISCKRSGGSSQHQE